MKSHALYRFYGDTGQLLYVGISSDPARRFGQHAATKSWWGSVRGITLDWYSSRQDVMAAEKRAIEVERPLMNLSRPALQVPPQECGHCVGCLRADAGPCQVYGLDRDDDLNPGPCRVCQDPHCIFETGIQAGEQLGWSMAHDFYVRRGGKV